MILTSKSCREHLSIIIQKIEIYGKLQLVVVIIYYTLIHQVVVLILMGVMIVLSKTM